MSYNFHIYTWQVGIMTLHQVYLVNPNAGLTVLLESVASKADHDKHVIHVFT